MVPLPYDIARLGCRSRTRSAWVGILDGSKVGAVTQWRFDFGRRCRIWWCLGFGSRGRFRRDFRALRGLRPLWFRWYFGEPGLGIAFLLHQGERVFELKERLFCQAVAAPTFFHHWRASHFLNGFHHCLHIERPECTQAADLGAAFLGPCNRVRLHWQSLGAVPTTSTLADWSAVEMTQINCYGALWARHGRERRRR